MKAPLRQKLSLTHGALKLHRSIYSYKQQVKWLSNVKGVCNDEHREWSFPSALQRLLSAFSILVLQPTSSLFSKSPNPTAQKTHQHPTSGFFIKREKIQLAFACASNDSEVVTGVYRLQVWLEVMEIWQPSGHSKFSPFAGTMQWDTATVYHPSPSKQCSKINPN